MKSLNKTQIASVAAASVLMTYIGVAASLQASQTPQAVDWSAVLTADAATVDYFLKIDGVEGESTDERHKGQIELLSWSFGASQTSSFAMGSRAAMGKVQMQDLHFTMAMSKASPVLFLKCATGEHIKEAILTARKAGAEQQEYLTIKLTDVMVTSYQTTGNGDIPMEEVSLNFAKIEIEYKPQNPDGSLATPVRAGWDLKLNKKV
jgi:type VI secretion system secreted protein Hcp